MVICLLITDQAWFLRQELLSQLVMIPGLQLKVFNQILFIFQERTDKVREEYDKILQQKLSEQYDAFVKFIDHQIQQRFNESQLPSYLS